MRLVIAHPSLNRCGGAERVCLTTIKALSEHGHSVHLATIDRTDWRFLEERIGRLQRPQSEQYLLDTIPFSGILSQSAYTVTFFLPLLARYRTAGNYDLVVNTYGDLDQSIADIAYINAIPFRLMPLFPNSTFQSPAMRLLTSAFTLSTSPANRLLTRNLLLTNSTFMRDLIKRHLARDSLVIFPPVDLQRFKCSPEQQERENVVVTVTRLRLGKQLEMIPQIARNVRDCRFIILALQDAGSAESLNTLKRSIKTQDVEDRVEIRINQSPKAIADTLTTSKVYLQTQEYEAFGISVVEAMASGCVPVVPRNGGPWIDILGRDESTYGFSFDSPQEAATKINLLCSDEQVRRKTAERALTRASRFDSKLFENQIASLVNHVLQAQTGT
jgi:glycosyltransferase involved in cell wall biosynthesis